MHSAICSDKAEEIPDEYEEIINSNQESRTSNTGSALTGYARNKPYVPPCDDGELSYEFVPRLNSYGWVCHVSTVEHTLWKNGHSTGTKKRTVYRW